MVAITGRPGIGKTTTFLRVVDSLRSLGIGLGGFVSREVRVGGIRVGFEIMDLDSGAKGWLSHINQHDGPRIGKYRVNIGDLIEIGVGAIQRAIEEKSTKIIAVDEIGPMELTSSVFVRAVCDAIRSTKEILATLHYRERDQILAMFNLSIPAALFEVTLENRETIHNLIVDAVSSRNVS
jgi:nucleoside-triphosphatase